MTTTFTRRHFVEGSLLTIALAGTGRVVYAHQATATQEEDATALADSVDIEMGDGYFEPNTFTMPADTDFTVKLNNVGELAHDFTVEDQDLQSDLVDPGTSAEFVLNLPAGDYVFYCSQPGHRELGMEGTFTVKEATSVDIEMGDGYFEPNTFTMPADTDFTVKLNNVGELAHDFTVEDEDMQSDLVDPGTTAEFVLNLPAGDYVFYCSQPGHRELGMEGTIIVA